MSESARLLEATVVATLEEETKTAPRAMQQQEGMRAKTHARSVTSTLVKQTTVHTYTTRVCMCVYLLGDLCGYSLSYFTRRLNHLLLLLGLGATMRRDDGGSNGLGEHAGAESLQRLHAATDRRWQGDALHEQARAVTASGRLGGKRRYREELAARREG